MLLVQSDLFVTEPCLAESPNEEVAAVLRSRLNATLALVKSATSMPWTEPLSIIREENAFRFGKDALPAEEGERLWAEFDAEMERLYATANRDG